MFWVNRSSVQIPVLIHGKLMDIDCDFLHPAEHLASVFVKDRQIAHFVAGINLVTRGGEAQWRNMSPLIDVFPIWRQALDSMNSVLIGLSAVGFYLPWLAHVIMKVAAAEIRHENPPFRILSHCVRRVELRRSPAPATH